MALRREKLSVLYDLLHKGVYAYTGAQVRATQNPNLINIKLLLQQADLKRFSNLNSSLSFMLDKSSKSLVSLTPVP